jgi:hypothetical protein
MTDKNEHLHIRASREDNEKARALGEKLGVGVSAAVWYAVRFALENAKLFIIWVRNNGDEKHIL